jgi:hypothetical protein
MAMYLPIRTQVPHEAAFVGQRKALPNLVSVRAKRINDGVPVSATGDLACGRFPDIAEKRADRLAGVRGERRVCRCWRFEMDPGKQPVARNYKNRSAMSLFQEREANVDGG